MLHNSDNENNIVDRRPVSKRFFGLSLSSRDPTESFCKEPSFSSEKLFLGCGVWIVFSYRVQLVYFVSKCFRQGIVSIFMLPHYLNHMDSRTLFHVDEFLFNIF